EVREVRQISAQGVLGQAPAHLQVLAEALHEGGLRRGGGGLHIPATIPRRIRDVKLPAEPAPGASRARRLSSRAHRPQRLREAGTPKAAETSGTGSGGAVRPGLGGRQVDAGAISIERV